MRFLKFFLLLYLLLVPAMANAVQPDEILSDPKLESRARDISTGLRCLVCQNQSIDDSDAPLARDLRLIVRERLKAGDTDDMVFKFVVARYGNFVLLKPPMNLQTLLLWLLPLITLICASIVIVLNVRRRRSTLAVADPLSASEQSKLRDILDKK